MAEDVPTTVAGAGWGDGAPGVFHHEAFFYAGLDEFIDVAVAFIEGALRADQPMMVAVSAQKIRILSDRLGPGSASVSFLDMGEVGRNPARIIPIWRQFVASHAVGGRQVRGIGEPIWSSRSAPELVECQHHESLLNEAFGPDPAWWLMCPYDSELLDESVLEEARHSHPFVRSDGASGQSLYFRDGSGVAPLEAPLPEPHDPVQEISFDGSSLSQLRLFLAHAVSADLPADQGADLVLAAHEIAANSVLHGGGFGTLRTWCQGGTVVCEVRDSGRIERALVGRERPQVDGEMGRGLWLANQLCDLVQLRSSSSGTVVRLHMSRR
ncbi:MAG: anti-sigma factor RsbA family regulatory protein [Acidimicrobiales bacterium]